MIDLPVTYINKIFHQQESPHYGTVPVLRVPSGERERAKGLDTGGSTAWSPASAAAHGAEGFFDR
mgnify:CR=1 FL=1